MEPIKAYLAGELSGSALEQSIADFEQHPDIAAEFAHWITTGEFADNVKIEGHVASDIKKMANFMSGTGVYEFLIALREDPDEAKSYIEEGFPIK